MDAYVKSMGYDRERDIDKVRLGLHEGGKTGSSGWRSFCPVAYVILSAIAHVVRDFSFTPRSA